MKLKLQQGQVWKNDDDYFRIVELERLEVKFKVLKSLAEREGEHQHVTKKEFCRLIKNAVLLTKEEVKAKQQEVPPAPVLPPKDPSSSEPSA